MPPPTGLGWQGQGVLPRFAFTGLVTLFWSSSRMDFGIPVSSPEIPVCGPSERGQMLCRLPGSPGAKVRGLRARSWRPDTCPLSPRQPVFWEGAQGVCGGQVPQVSSSAHSLAPCEMTIPRSPAGIRLQETEASYLRFPRSQQVSV